MKLFINNIIVHTINRQNIFYIFYLLNVFIIYSDNVKIKEGIGTLIVIQIAIGIQYVLLVFIILGIIFKNCIFM